MFSICDESKYLLIHNVSDIKTCVKRELFQLCQRFGPIERLILADYPICEDFTKVYLIKNKKFVNAVLAKKSLDDKNFLGSVLHVCYAQEFDIIEETKNNLFFNRRQISRVLGISLKEMWYRMNDCFAFRIHKSLVSNELLKG